MATREQNILARILDAVATIPDALKLNKRQQERMAQVGRQAIHAGASDAELREKIRAFVDTIAPPSHAVPTYNPAFPKPGDLRRAKRRTDFVRPMKVPGPAFPIAFASFLRQRLIPDLKESGNVYTAEDFETAATMIETLAVVVDILWPDRDPDAPWDSETIEHVAQACGAYRPGGK